MDIIGGMDTAARDFKYAVRTLRRSPGFVAVAALTLALGIGANTAIFSLLDQILLRLLPVQNPHQLVPSRRTTRCSRGCFAASRST